MLEVIFCGLFLLLYVLYIIRIKKLAVQFGQQANLLWVKFGLRTFYFALLVLAILGPSFGAMKKEIRTVGKDIIIALDLSQSMDATDVLPSRLHKVKYALTELIQRFDADRIGLITFSSEAFLHCPLTYDQSALLLYTQTLHTNLVPRAGTEFQPALDLAFQKLNGHQSLSYNRAKVVLLISDGENFGEPFGAGLRRFGQENIRLFTLGVGTAEGGFIPEGNGIKKDPDGKEVVTRLHAGKLREMASEGNGRYFEINESINEADKLINAINSVEGEVQQARTVEITANKYFYPLLLALLLVTLDVLLTLQVIRI